MKKFMFCFLAVAFTGFTALAQEMDTRKEKRRIKTEQKQMKQLDMQGNQGQQIKRINARYRDEHKLIMKNESLSQAQKQEQVKALNAKRVAEIHALIGKEKGDEWDGIQKQQKEKDKEMAKQKENRGQEKKAEKAAKDKKRKKDRTSSKEPANTPAFIK